MKKTYSGRCHCGAVQFEADIDVAAGSMRCNCSIRAMGRLWSFEVAPADLRLLSGAEALADYVFGERVAHHYFCRHCGIRPYEYVDLPDGRRYHNVNVACLDGLDVDALMAAPIVYMDGLHDRWDLVPAEIRLL